MSWFIEAVKKYAVFKERSRRREYWYFVLFFVVISVVLSIVDAVIGTYDSASGVGLLSGIFGLALLVPSIAVAVRRLHDTDRSGWWVLISLVPVIGGIVLLVFTVQDGTPGSNRYGPSPKTATA